MDTRQIIRSYFPRFNEEQVDSLLSLEAYYRYWNQRINVVSRKDIDNLFMHHVLHSLSIALYVDFPAGIRVIDAGTGGGFPGIPLAIAFPGTEFCLVDSTAKKLDVVDDVCMKLGLSNVTTYHIRLEEFKIDNQAIISRAVSALPVFTGWARHLLAGTGSNHMGIYYLKGGDVEQEAEETGLGFAIHDLEEKLPFPYFATKKLVHLLP